jgi:hypothetical protein
VIEAATWIGVIAGCVVAITAVVALAVAWRQLINLGSTLKISSLNTILDIEAQMNARKEKVDTRVEDIQRAGVTLSKEQAKLEQDALDSRLENWFNAVDRLAFCVLRNLVPEKDWRVEYRDYINNIVVHHNKSFQVGSRYRNILDLNSKWQRE